MGDIDSARDANANIGVTLRAYRLRGGRDLAEAAETLHIRKTFLQAIEDGRYEDLPGPTYASGFVRAYAEYLDLDGEEAVRRFKRETLGRKIGGDLHFPAPESEGGVPKGAVLLISALLAVIAYAGWYFVSSSDTDVSELVASPPKRLAVDQAPPHEPVPAIDHAADRAAREEQPAADDQPSVDDQPSASPAPSVGGAAAVEPPPAMLGSPVPTSPSPASPPPAPAETEAAPSEAYAAPPPAIAAQESPAPSSEQPPPPAAQQAGSTAPTEPGAQSADNERIVLNATADSWIELRGRNQRVVLSRVLQAGETLPVEDGRGLTLTTGNAGGLEIILDGNPLPPLGRAGRVRRGIVLDAAALERLRAGGN